MKTYTDLPYTAEFKTREHHWPLLTIKIFTWLSFQGTASLRDLLACIASNEDNSSGSSFHGSQYSRRRSAHGALLPDRLGGSHAVKDAAALCAQFYWSNRTVRTSNVIEIPVQCTDVAHKVAARVAGAAGPPPTSRTSRLHDSSICSTMRNLQPLVTCCGFDYPRQGMCHAHQLTISSSFRRPTIDGNRARRLINTLLDRHGRCSIYVLRERLRRLLKRQYHRLSMLLSGSSAVMRLQRRWCCKKHRGSPAPRLHPVASSRGADLLFRT